MRKLLLALSVWPIVLFLFCGFSHAGNVDLEKDLNKALHASQRLAAKALQKAEKGQPVKAEVERLLHQAEQIRAIHLLMTERYRLRGEKAKKLGGKALARQEAMARRYREAFAELLAAFDRISAAGSVSPAFLESLQEILNRLTPRKQYPIYGSLPYRQPGYPAAAPVMAPTVIPAYRGGTATVAGDLAGSAEAPISKRIAAQAQSLEWNPVKIYEWVKNNVETEWYWGCMKGAEETLRQGSGNDADQAALLAALLRASGFRARYVRGVIEFFPEDLAKVANLTGVQDPDRMGEFFQRAGIPFQKKMSGLDLVNYQIEHVWVEAEVPYSNYRGLVSDPQGKIWLGLDTSIKVAGYAETPGALDLYAEPGNPLPAIRDDYLAGPQLQTPLAFLKDKVQQFLDLNHPGTLYNAVLTTRQLNAESLKILPASLQFTEVAVTGEYAALPAALLHRVRLSVPGAGGEPALDITRNAFELSNQKVVLSYEPETVEDQEIINSWGGLDTTPSYLVRLRPVLLVNGERLAVGREGYPVGGPFSLTVEVVSPNGVETVGNTPLAGYPAVLGIVSQQPVPPDPATLKNEAVDLLYREALNYLGSWNRGEQELASLLRVSLVRPVPAVVTMGGVLEVVTLLGEPQGAEWKGLFVDADLRLAGPVSQVPTADERGKTFMQLSALEGSVQEHKVFEDAFAVESISTAKLLGVAAGSSVAVLTLDAANIDAELPASLADNVKADITDAVKNQGLTVRVPQSEITVSSWTGSGWIKENPATGEAGYMLSGTIAGGSTVLGVEVWPEGARQTMSSPYTGAPNENPADAFRISQVTPYLIKLATAGQETNGPLMVQVRDDAGAPVKGAPVTFSVRAGGGHLLDDSVIPEAPASSLTATTDFAGIARVRFVAGQRTDDNGVSYSRDGDTYPNIVGENLIDAQLESGSLAALQSPIAVLGFAGEPDLNLLQVTGNDALGDILSYSGNAVLYLRDQYSNPVANYPVTFQALDPVPWSASQCSDLSVFDQSRLKAQIVNGLHDCLETLPAYGECSAAQNPYALVSTSGGTAGVGVILGMVPYARYPVKATFTTTANGPVTTTISHHSRNFGSCGGTAGPANKIVLSHDKAFDELGNNVDARPAGRSATVRAKAYLLGEGEKILAAGQTLYCDGDTQITCDRVVGDGNFAVSEPATLAVTINGQTGTRAVDPADGLTPLPGLYETQVTLPIGLNDVPLEASASKEILKITNSCAGCGQPATESTAIGPVAGTAQIWGVDIRTPQVLLIPVDADGYALQDVVFTYDILPAQYVALLAQVRIFKNGKQAIPPIPTGTSGSPSITIPAGFWFDTSSSYELEVLLNNLGDANEIRSERVPIGFGRMGAAFQVERVHLVSEFDATVPDTIGSPYVDGYQSFTFNLTEPSSAKVVILDENFQQAAVLVPETALAAGDHRFVVDYEMVKGAGFGILGSPTFYVRLEHWAASGSSVSSTIYPGRMSERTGTAKMLGQVMVHDVLIQDGSLNLSRTDAAFNGRGPRFAFSRSYNNQNSPRGHKPLGKGWSHSLDLRLQLLNYDQGGNGPVPDWVNTLKGQFYVDGDVPQGPKPWTVVQVNGAVFKKVNGLWYAERGKHGKLEEIAGGFLFTAKDGTRYRYDQPIGTEFRVGSIEDRNGNALTFTYDALGHLEKVVDAVGRQFLFTYELMAVLAEGDPYRLTRVACPDGVTLDFTYDGRGYLQIARRGARVESYFYAPEPGIAGAEFNLVKVTDANNHSFGYEYHGPGEVDPALAGYTKVLKSQDVIKRVVYPDGSAAGFAYDVLTANKRIVTDLRDKAATYTLNDYGNPIKIEEPLGKVTDMTWSIDQGLPDNVMTSRTVTGGTLAAPVSLTTAYEYDAKGNVAKETDPYGKFILTSWNQVYSLPESRTDRNGVVQTWSYDPANGNLLWHENGDQKRTNYTYYATGEVQTETDPRLNVTTFTYDLNGNPDTVTGAEGSVTDFDYDVRGRKVAETDPNGNQTVYAYDDLDYPASITYPALTSYALPAGSTNVKTFLYDPVGNLKSETDRVGLTLTYTYTSRNQVASISRSTGGKKTFAYDENGSLTSETDWKGGATTHTYDALNRRDSTTNRLGDSMSMAYDLAGNLIQATDYEGRVTDYEYDKLSRRTKVSQPLLPGQSVRGEIVTTYYNEADPKTNVKTVTDAEGHTTTFEYNGRYQKTKRINALLDQFVWVYDDAGNLEKEIDEAGGEIRYVYDKQNRRTFTYQAVKDEFGAIVREIPTEVRYDAAGNARFLVDARGHITETTYDQWNRPWQTITPADPVAYTTTTERDGEGREVKVTDGNGNFRTWLRDRRGLVLTATDAENFATTYTYDQNGNVETVTNARGFLTRITWDAEDRKLLTTEAEGTPEERVSGVVAYDKVGNPVQVRDGNGNVTVTEYNGLNLPWKRYDPAPFDANFVETLYDKNGKPVSVKNRLGHVTTTQYDELGRLTTVTDPAPFTTQTVVTTYDKVGRVMTVTDKRGILSENVYDSLGRLVEQRRAGVRLVSNEYDDAGNLTAAVDAENNRVEYAYSPRNLLTTTTFIDGVNNYTELRTYDGVGNLLTVTNEQGEVTTYVYDKENRQKSVSFAGETTTHVYDAVGNPTQVIKPKGNGRTMTYDGLNRLATVDDGGLITTYAYDADGNLRTQTDPRGNVVEYTYDELNRKTQHIQHKSSGDLVVHFDLYDAEGNLKQMTDAKGQVFTYVYDELGRRTDVNYPLVLTAYLAPVSTHTGYDANNNVTAVTETKKDSLGATVTDVTTNTYDNFDRLETSAQRGVTVTYGYDANGNRTSVATAGGSTTYTYDHRNRLQTAVVGTDVTTYTYTPDGLKETVSYPNGASTAYTYFPTNRIETITHRDGAAATLSSYAYQYDANGNRTRQVEVQGGASETTDYVYDGLDRLESYTLTAGADVTVTGYTFEGYNRKTETVTVNGVTTVSKTYTYDETDWLTQVVDTAPATPVTITYGFDNNGNTIQKSDSSKPGEDVLFDYDVANHLVQTTQGAATLGKYDYNAQGLRVRHYGSERGDVSYYYDDGAVLEERLAGGALLAHYRYADRLMSLDTGSGVQYYHHDALGSTVNLTDSAGAAQVSYKLDPWGHIREQQGTSVNRQIFTGQEHDEQTGLIYFGARYYDPDSARFISQDSYLGEPGTPPSLHRYLYAYSNPTVYVDLMGYESVEVDDDNQVYWNVEKDWIGPYNPTVRRVHIGTYKEENGEGRVYITAEFGGGVLAHEGLKKAVGDFWGRRRADSVMDQADISGYGPSYQDQLIKSYIDLMNPHGEDRMYANMPMRSKMEMYDEEYGVSVRADGVAKVAVAAGEAAGAATLAAAQEPTMLTKVGAVALAGHAADLAASGMQQIIYGKPNQPYVSRGIQEAYELGGMNPATAHQYAELTNYGIGGLGEAWALRINLGLGATVDATLASPTTQRSRTWNEFQAGTKGQFSSRTEASAAWRVYKQSNQAEKTLVIGRLADTSAAELQGFQRLNDPAWTPAVNDAWVQGAIDASRPLKLVSPVQKSTLFNPPGSRFPTTIFMRELQQLKNAGYTIRGGWALPPGS